MESKYKSDMKQTKIQNWEYFSKHTQSSPK